MTSYIDNLSIELLISIESDQIGHRSLGIEASTKITFPSKRFQWKYTQELQGHTRHFVDPDFFFMFNHKQNKEVDREIGKCEELVIVLRDK